MFEACRFSRISNFCKLAKIHRVLDGPYVLYYGIFLAVWGKFTDVVTVTKYSKRLYWMLAEKSSFTFFICIILFNTRVTGTVGHLS